MTKIDRIIPGERQSYYVLAEWVASAATWLGVITAIPQLPKGCGEDDVPLNADGYCAECEENLEPDR